jgi:Fe-S cluster assembly protein SufD
MVNLNDHFTQVFQKAESYLPGEGHLPIRTLRRQALTAALKHGLPTLKDENWKYNRLERFLDIPFILSLDIETNPGSLPAWINGYIFQNNNPKSLAINSDAAPPFTCLSFEQLATTQPDFMEPYFSLPDRYDYFEALNFVFCQIGSVIIVPSNMTLDSAIVIVHSQDNINSPAMQHNQLHFILEKNATATLIEIFDLQSEKSLLNTKSTVTLKEHAKLNHIILDNSNLSSLNISHLAVLQQDHSEYYQYFCLLGNSLTKCLHQITMQGNQSIAQITGILLPNEHQHIDHVLKVDLIGESTQCHVETKSVISKQGHASFKGNMTVHSTAQNADAKLFNHNILLDETARVETRPQLEIFADAVHCTHGATIGEFDEEELFYAASKGISKEIAKQILLQAFALSTIKSTPLISTKLSEIINLRLDTLTRLIS